MEDVREVLEYYRQFDNPIEAFRENQRKLQENLAAEDERKAKEMETKKTSLLSGWSGFRRRV